MKPMWWQARRDNQRWSKARNTKVVDADAKANPVEARWKKKNRQSLV
jgi:hypothetical protein